MRKTDTKGHIGVSDECSYLYDERAYLYNDPELGIKKTDAENKHWKRWKNRYQKCINMANRRGGKWLDAACGSGYGTEMIAEVAGYVIGIDKDSKTVAYARKHHQSFPNIRFINRDILDLTIFEERSFDVIVSVETIEHLVDPRSFLVRIHELLKSDGIFLVTTPESHVGGGPNPHNPFHLNEYTLVQLKEVLTGIFRRVHLETERAMFTTGLDTNQIYAACYKCQSSGRR